jgi:hypothetical protein
VPAAMIATATATTTRRYFKLDSTIHRIIADTPYGRVL